MISLSNILLVEDNAAHVELILRAFSSTLPECKVDTCSSLGKAQELISSHLPQVVITDLNLPDGKGLQLLAESQQQPYPLILMTSYGDENIAVDAIKSGAYDYIVKSPENFDTMPRAAERVLREWDNTTNTLRIQKELFHKEREQAEILDSITDGVITTNEEGIILTFNKASENIFGLTSNEAVGKNINLLINRPLQNIDPDEKIASVTEVIANHKSSRVFPIRLSLVELSKDADGNRRFINTCHDLSQEKLQAEQLRRSQKMEALGKLTGGITHDYNNMLSVVLGYSELLSEILIDDPIPSKYVKEIKRACDRSTQLTKKLLSFSKYKKNDATALNINAILSEQQDMLMRTLTARITLRLNLDNDLWNVIVDNNDLGDTILNICINAMHAIEDKGELTISTQNVLLNLDESSLLELNPGEYVSLSITDSGCGMDDATKERIFDPFYTTKGENGTGLGLSQVYGFVDRSNGSINIESDKSNGSKFTLYFPRHNGDVCQNENHETAKNYYKGDETILIVDDEPALLNLSAEILRKSGYNVLKTTSPIHALKILKSNTISLLLSDVIMPEMDGYELATIVKEEYPMIKIQLASGYSETKDSNMYHNNLHKEILLKPYTMQQLLIKIRGLLDNENSISLSSRN